MVKIIEMFIPASNKKTRPGIKMNPTSITIHETDNTNVRANALAHARLQQNGNSRQASWHLSVDDEPEVYQSLPFNEVGYHAGTTSGNYNSIGMEICVNSDGDYKKAVNNAIQTVKWLLNKYPSIKAVNVVQHNHWSGKNCPRNLRSGAKGIKWNAFIKALRDGKKVEASKPAEPPKYTSTTGSIKVGQKVTLKKSAKNYATGESIPSQYKGKSYTVQQRGSNRVLLKELYSWVKTSDISGASASKPAEKKPKPAATGDARVKEIQRWVSSPADGIPGPDTWKQLTKKLQSELNEQFSAGLKVDGIWGPKTRAAIATIRPGAKGDLTKVLQSALYLAGYTEVGKPDGIYGDNTKKALGNYQKAKGLAVDHVAGKATFTKLFG